MHYEAFISYSHAADGKLAPALQSALHRVAKPWWRLRSMRVFRDRTNLSANPHLWPSIERALGESEYLLLFASPQSAGSRWVEEEVTWWLTESAHTQPLDRLLILLTGGDLVWDPAAGDYDWTRTSALPEGLRGRIPDEPLYVDFRWAHGSDELSMRHTKFRDAALTIAATLLGRDKDRLDGEDVRQHRRNFAWAAGAAAALALTTLAALGAAVIADYQRGLAVSRQLAARAELLAEQQPARLPAAVELSAEALRRASRFRFLDPAQAFESTQTLQSALSLLASKPAYRDRTRGRLSLRLSPDARYLAHVPYDGPLTIQDMADGAVVAELPPPRVGALQADGLREAVFSADGSRIAAVAQLGLAGLVWSLPDGEELFRTPGSGIVAMALSPEGHRVAAADTGGGIRVRDLNAGTELASFRLTGPARLLRFGPKGRLLAASCSTGIPGTCGDEAQVTLWDVARGEQVATLDHEAAVTDVVFSPDAERLATTRRVGPEQQPPRRVGRVSIWETASGRRVARVEQPEQVTALEFTRNGAYLLAAAASDARLVTVTHDLRADAATDPRQYRREVRAWSLDDLAALLPLTHPHLVGGLRFSGDASRLATFDTRMPELQFIPGDRPGGPRFEMTDPGAGSLRLWEVASRRQLAAAGHPAAVLAFDLSADGRRLASAAADGRARVFDAAGSMLASRTWDGWVVNVAFDPDGRWLAVGTGGEDPKAPALRSGATVLWDLHHNSRTTLTRQASWTGAVAFSPNGSHLAAIDQDGRIGVWDLPDLREVGRLRHGAQSPEVRVRFAPDGGHLLSVVDETAKIWDVGTGREVARHRHELGSLRDAGFSPDGAWLATASTDATARLWRWRPADLVADACRRLPATMSESEWQDLVGRQVRRRHVCARLTGKDP